MKIYKFGSETGCSAACHRNTQREFGEHGKIIVAQRSRGPPFHLGRVQP